MPFANPSKTGSQLVGGDPPEAKSCAVGKNVARRVGVPAGGRWRGGTARVACFDSSNLKMFVVHGCHAVGVCVLHDVGSSIDSSSLPFVTSTSYWPWSVFEQALQ